MTPGRRYLSFLNRFVTAGSTAVACIGVAVLFDWAADAGLFKSLLPTLATMKANTAVAFVTAGVSLLLLHTSSANPHLPRLARALSMLVAAIGGLSVLEDFYGFDFGIDQLLFLDAATGAAAYPGRMSPITAVGFVFSGLALLSLKARHARVAFWANWFAAATFFLSTLAVIGYAYGVSSLYKVGPFTSMALHTALAFLVLSLSILAADTSRGIGSLISSDSAGGAVTRRLLPTISLALFVIGWIRLAGQQAGLYDTSFGLALMVVLSMAVSIFSISHTGIALRKVDLTRRRAEAAIIELNAGLERRVAERTEKLAQLSDDLSAANIALEKLSLMDSLTAIANRRALDSYLATQIAVARRHSRPLSLVLCDIDWFKEYNDHHGHQAGDAVLQRVAAALRSYCRRPADLAARYGGEEFVLVLPDTDMAGACLIAEAARAAVERLGIVHEHAPAGRSLTISGGVATLAADIESSGQMIGVADRLLYEAKRRGRNRMISDEVLAPERTAAFFAA